MNEKLVVQSRIAAAGTTLGVGLAAILSAWGFQLIGGYVPCKLCLEERVFYYVGLPIALLALISSLRNGPVWLTRGLLVLTGLVFLGGTCLGVYHAGAEWGWWPGPSDCGGGVTPTTNAADLLAAIAHTRVVSCVVASWRFPAFDWGLSFAGWNAAVSAFCSVVALAGAAARVGDRVAIGAPSYGSSSVSQ